MSSDEQEGRRLPKQDGLLIYDGECCLCVSIQQKLEKLGTGHAESDFRFVAYQSEAAKRLLGSDYRSGRPHTAFWVRPSGEVLKGLEAFFPLIPKLPGGKILLWWLHFHSAKRLAEWGYRMVARHRYRWFGEVNPPRRQHGT